VSVNQPPRGKQQIPITQELIQRIAALVGTGGAVSLFPAQNDILAFPDDCDASFPYRFDFVLPSNFQKILSARLSWKLRNYRTYNTFTVAATGAGSAHLHGVSAGTGAETGHSHSHNHTVVLAFNNGFGTTLGVFLPSNHSQLAWGGAAGADDGGNSLSTNATASSGHTHGVNNTDNESAHTHPISGSSFLGITEDVPPLNPGITVAIDGTDYTAKLGGPFQNDVLELDIRPYLPKTTGVFHTLSLQPNQRCRIHGILRLSYNVQPGLS
jgi:hypothetical protein